MIYSVSQKLKKKLLNINSMAFDCLAIHCNHSCDMHEQVITRFSTVFQFSIAKREKTEVQFFFVFSLELS